MLFISLKPQQNTTEQIGPIIIQSFICTQSTVSACYTSRGMKWLHARGSLWAKWSSENAWTLSGIDAAVMTTGVWCLLFAVEWHTRLPVCSQLFGWYFWFDWSPSHSAGCIQVTDFCCCTELGHHKPVMLSGQDRSETNKIGIDLGLACCGLGLGLGLADLVLCWETRSYHACRHNDLEGHNNFSSTIYSFYVLCLEHHYCGYRQWRSLV